MLILDILIIAIMVLTVISYAKKGLVLVLLSFVSYIASTILAWMFGSLIGDKILPTVESAIGKVEHIGKLLPAETIADGLGFIIVFVVAMIVCGFVAKLFSKKIDIPVVAQINHLLGGICGLILALLFVNVLVLIIFLPMQLIAIHSESIADLINESHIAKWFFDHNLIRALFNF